MQDNISQKCFVSKQIQLMQVKYLIPHSIANFTVLYGIHLDRGANHGCSNNFPELKLPGSYFVFWLALQSAVENLIEELFSIRAFTEYHLTNLRRAIWAVWLWRSCIAWRHSSALDGDKNSTHLSLIYWLANVAVGWWATMLCSSCAALDLKNRKEKEAGALWVQQSSLALHICGSVSLHTDLQWSAIRLFPV